MTNTATIAIWQPIETAPKGGTKVLLAFDDGKVLIGQYVDTVRLDFGKPTYASQYWETDCDMRWKFGPRIIPTHWMPLPSAPTRDAESAA